MPNPEKLSDLARDLSIEEKEHAVRSGLVRTISWLFIGTNLFVFAGLVFCFYYDIILMHDKVISPSDRLINSNVITTLIGATAVQVATMMLAISGYFFPKRAREK